MTSRGIGCDFSFDGVGWIAPGPDAGFLALDSDRAAHKQLMTDVEARTAECNNLGSQLNAVAKPRRSDKPGARIDQGQRIDTKCGGELGRPHTQRRFKQAPGAPVEIFEKPAVKDNAGRIAVRPLDRKLPSVEKIGHGIPQSAAPVMAINRVFGGMSNRAWRAAARRTA